MREWLEWAWKSFEGSLSSLLNTIEDPKIALMELSVVGSVVGALIIGMRLGAIRVGVRQKMGKEIYRGFVQSDHMRAGHGYGRDTFYSPGEVVFGAARRITHDSDEKWLRIKGSAYDVRKFMTEDGGFDFLGGTTQKSLGSGMQVEWRPNHELPGPGRYEDFGPPGGSDFRPRDRRLTVDELSLDPPSEFE
jgi:hypothetical protein